MNSEKVTIHIVKWLKDYAKKANVKGFVIGVSGGVDSAVTSTLCAKTGFKTLCVEMPIHQDSHQVSRARDHIEKLKKNYINVINTKGDLTSPFESFQKVFPTPASKGIRDLALANTRARIRMTFLYYLASVNTFLVAGTGNKVEDFGVGFYTKYGDGGVDISPIADLLKSEVFSLASSLGVLDSIQKAKPTDGLFDDSRTDEEQLGASYDELEWAMRMSDLGKVSSDFSGREKDVFQIYTRLNKINQHKMNPIPVCKIPEELKH